MSTFTDGWNGPGRNCCDNGNTIPQVKTLEELLAQIATLTTAIGEVEGALEEHIDKTVTGTSEDTVHGILARLRAELATITTAIEDEATDRATEDATLLGYIDSIIDPTSLAIQDSGQVANYVKNKANAAEQNAKTYTDDKIGALGSNTVKAYVDAINTTLTAAITALRTKVVTDQIEAATPNGKLTITSFIAALEGLRGALYPDHIIDYRNFANIQVYCVSISGNDSLSHISGVPDEEIPRNLIAVLGVLSTTYDASDGDPDDTADLTANNNTYGYAHKAARVFLKYIDTKPWNAILDLVFTKKYYGTDNIYYNGAIGGSIAKTIDRNYLGFGLYHASDRHGVEHIYLGVKCEDMLTYNYSTGFNIRVAGLNFIPLTGDLVPNSALQEIETVPFVTNRGGTVFNKVTVQTMFSDNYRDVAGHGVAITDEANGVLKLGAPNNDPDFIGITNETHAMELYSKTRPDVFVGNGGAAPMANYHMAFLEDLAQSMYFQRDVIIAVDYITKPVGATGPDLTDLKVWQLDGVVVPPNTPNATQVPGFYTMDPSGLHTNGHIFVNNDVVLVKASAATEAVVDGYINTTLSVNVAASYAIALITGISEIRVGATVVDSTGRIGIVTAYTSGTANVFISTVAASNPRAYTYTLPAYVTFNGTTFGGAVPIPLPKATPGNYLHDISYEWAGSVGPKDRGTPDTMYYEPGFEIWTPQHQNPVWDPDGIGDPNPAWSKVHFDLDGYRSASRQDQIDLSLYALATVQPDYGEMEQVAQWQLPEGDVYTAANPSYIHNRPWTGLAVLDGGTFGEVPDMYAGWLVDGGDFTDFNTSIPGYVTPPVPGDNQFRNVIIRLWHGLAADMPENKSNTAATWANFTRTLRFVDDITDKALYYSDGAVLYKFIPGTQVYTTPYASTSRFWHENDGGGYQYLAGGMRVASAANYGATDHIWYEIYAVNATTSVGARLILSETTAYLTRGKNSSAYTAADEIVVKGDLTAIIPAPPTTPGIYKLTVTVASGGAATYSWGT